MHGGMSPTGPASPHFGNGKRSKYQYLPANMSARFEKLSTDTLENLEESINIQRALETEVLNRVGTGESLRSWKRLTAIVGETAILVAKTNDDDLQTEYKARAFDLIENEVVEGAASFASQSAARRDLHALHESQRKMTETLMKARKEMQETYTHEQWGELLGRILNILKKRLTPELLASVAFDIEAERAPKQITS